MTVLSEYVAGWARFGLGDGDCFMFYDGVDLSLGIYVLDFRNLRVDLTETLLLLGEDRGCQYSEKLSPNGPGVVVFQKSEFSIMQLADFAADWITNELSRKIELREWITESYHYREWVLSDTNYAFRAQCLKGVCPRKSLLVGPAKSTIVYPPEP